MAEMMELEIYVVGKEDDVNRFFNIIRAGTEWETDPVPYDPEIYLDSEYNISYGNLFIKKRLDDGRVFACIEGATKYSIREWGRTYEEDEFSETMNKRVVSVNVLTKILDLAVFYRGFESTYGEDNYGQIVRGKVIHSDEGYFIDTTADYNSNEWDGLKYDVEYIGYDWNKFKEEMDTFFLQNYPKEFEGLSVDEIVDKYDDYELGVRVFAGEFIWDDITPEMVDSDKPIIQTKAGYRFETI